MSDLETIGRPEAQLLGIAVEEALREVAEQHGLELHVNGGTYDANSFKPRVEFKTADAGRAEFVRWAKVYGLEESDFGREFTSQGRRYKVSGVSPRSPKRPIVCDEIPSGRTYKFTVDGVKQAFS